MSPEDKYKPSSYTIPTLTANQMSEFLKKFDKHLENATSVNNFYKLVLDDKKLGPKGVQGLEEIYDMPGIPENMRIFERIPQQDIENAVFYSQK